MSELARCHRASPAMQVSRRSSRRCEEAAAAVSWQPSCGLLPTTSAKISADHVGIALYVGWRALGDLAAAIQLGDAVRDVHHHRHVMFDQDDRGTPLRVHLQDKARHVFLLAL